MKKLLSILTAICLLLTAMCAYAQDWEIDKVIADTADYIVQSVSEPTVASIGGEWAVIGLARSGAVVPDGYFDKYYNKLVSCTEECKGILHERKYTEYSRVVLALTAIGQNPKNVGGYDLLMPLGDYEKTVWQGVNSAAYALIALDSGEYDVPINNEAKIQATREMYVDYIISCQHDDGGFSLSGATASEIDTTAMALQALAKYKDSEKVSIAIDKAIDFLSSAQKENGGFEDWTNKNSESCSQVLLALASLGIAADDVRFVKDGNTLTDCLMTYYDKGNGFAHSSDADSSNQMATEQALCAFGATLRMQNGSKSFFDMTDVTKKTAPVKTEAEGLSGKNANVKVMPVINEGKTFFDITGNKYQASIEKLAERGIINGMTDSAFEPDATMTRAEFATISVKALGLEAKNNKIFDDVSESDWFFGYVAAAYECGIINGVSATEFNPNGTITKEEAAAMTVRAAKVCGVFVEVTDVEIMNLLAQFDDYKTVSSWAEPSMAFCYKNGILSQEDISIMPEAKVLRCEIADMLYNMLKTAQLL